MRHTQLPRASPGTERGIALPIVIALMVLLFIAVANGAAIQTLAVTNVGVADVQAVYTAEAGLRDALSQLKASPAWVPGPFYYPKALPTSATSTYSVVVTHGPATVGTVVVPATDTYLQATGTVTVSSRNFSRRVSGVANQNGNLFKFAIFGANGVTLSGGTTSTSAGTNQSSITTNGSGTSAGTVTVNDALNLPDVTVPPGIPGPFPLNVGNGVNKTLTAGTYYYTDVNIKGTLTITGTVIIFLSAPTSGPDKGIGWDSTGGGVVNNATGNPANLQIYGTPAVKTIKMTGGSQAFAAIYAPEATMTLTGNGSSNPYFQGSAIAGNQIVGAGGVNIVYDPRVGSIIPPFGGLWQISGFHRL